MQIKLLVSSGLISFSTIFLKAMLCFHRDSLSYFCFPPVYHSATVGLEYKDEIMQNL